MYFSRGSSNCDRGGKLPPYSAHIRINGDEPDGESHSYHVARRKGEDNPKAPPGKGRIFVQEPTSEERACQELDIRQSSVERSSSNILHDAPDTGVRP